MRIITQRDEWETNCKNCNSTLGVEYKDIMYNGDVSFDTKCRIYCPACKTSFTIDLNSLPERWKNSLTLFN